MVVPLEVGVDVSVDVIVDDGVVVADVVRVVVAVLVTVVVELLVGVVVRVTVGVVVAVDVPVVVVVGDVVGDVVGVNVPVVVGVVDVVGEVVCCRRGRMKGGTARGFRGRVWFSACVCDHEHEHELAPAASGNANCWVLACVCRRVCMRARMHGAKRVAAVRDACPRQPRAFCAETRPAPPATTRQMRQEELTLVVGVEGLHDPVVSTAWMASPSRRKTVAQPPTPASSNVPPAAQVTRSSLSWCWVDIASMALAKTPAREHHSADGGCPSVRVQLQKGPEHRPRAQATGRGPGV